MHKENRAATGQGRGPGMTAAASVMSALIPCQGQREGAELGCFPQGVPSCQPGPAPPTKAASSKPGLITPPHHRLPCKPHYPHLAKWLGPEEEPPCRWGGWSVARGRRVQDATPLPTSSASCSQFNPRTQPWPGTHREAGQDGPKEEEPQAPQLPLPTTSAHSAQAPSTCQARFEGFEVYQRTE